MLTPSILMLARFGQWQQILKLPEPDNQYQYVLGIWHYARAMAELNLHQDNDATFDYDQLKKIIANGPVDAVLNQAGYRLLTLASDTLEGLFALHAQKIDKMAAAFQKAIQLQDLLYSADPPPWYYPIRELYGSALLKIGNAAQAKIIFMEDLKIHPHNGWSLYGLMRSEQLLHNNPAAKVLQYQFNTAWQYADIKDPVYPLN